MDAYITEAANTERSFNTTGLTFDASLNMWVVGSGSSNSETNNIEDTNSSPEVAETNSSSSVDSQLEADKQYIDIEFNTLEGDLDVKVTSKTFKLKINQTVKLVGFGTYLSGLYFISSVSRDLSNSNGYTQKLVLIKTGFGDSLKDTSTEVNTLIERQEVINI